VAGDRGALDWCLYPKLADNLWHAQMAGWPKALTYNGPDLTLRRAQRYAAMHYEHCGETFEIPRILSRDEYPFACTKEGGAGWIGHIPGPENSAQGGLIAGFLRRHSIVAGRGELSRAHRHACKMGTHRAAQAGWPYSRRPTGSPRGPASHAAWLPIQFYCWAIGPLYP
jgi:hypothetical protein